MIKPFAYSIAVMIFFLLVEYIFSRLMKKKVFEFSDTLTNLACGIMERTLFLLFAVLYYTSFNFIYDHFALFTIPKNWWTIVILFFTVDFLWYWYHRAGHEINVLWAAHITHHQSEEYNFSLSFRVSAFQLVIRMFFWLWLPLIGFDPILTTLIIGINAAYQFFIHTRLVDKLGVLEKVLVTPSHHRVHHGRNEQYIDKNYGGIFIIWDKIFGTFTEEKEEVAYGITKPLKSRNPVHAWFHYYLDLIGAAKQVKGLRNKLRVFFEGPETMGAYYDSLAKDYEVMPKEDKKLRSYLVVQYAIITTLFFGAYFYNEELSFSATLIVASFVIYSALSLGFVLDRHKWSFVLEVCRLILMSFALFMELLEFGQADYLIFSILPLLLFLPWIMKRKPSFVNN
ncbi:MAG: sterol desaturase family protein [Bacteroidetes bacterium]|nr:sterol desaturase family protein [Bacteroidota bacterium]